MLDGSREGAHIESFRQDATNFKMTERREVGQRGGDGRYNGERGE